MRCNHRGQMMNDDDDILNNPGRSSAGPHSRAAAIDAQENNRKALSVEPRFKSRKHEKALDAVYGLIDDALQGDYSGLYTSHRLNGGESFTAIAIVDPNLKGFTSKKLDSRIYAPLRAMGHQVVIGPSRRIIVRVLV